MWRKEWISSRPYNPISNSKYHGANTLKLDLAMIINRYSDPRWMTYKQAQSKGYQVMRGAKGVKCEKVIFDKKVKEKNEETGEMEEKYVRLKRPIITCFVLFNGSQIDGLEPLDNSKMIKQEDIYKVTRDMIDCSECRFEEGGSVAAYIPSKDVICMPERNLFTSDEAYAGTVMHEMIHSTGHETRLNRSIINKFGTPEYALEELRAELGSFFLEQDLQMNIGAEHYDSHAAYLQGWIKALKNDPNELFRACADADMAADFLMENYERYKSKEKEISCNERLNSDEISVIRMSLKLDNSKLTNISNKDHLQKWIEKHNAVERRDILMSAYQLVTHIYNEKVNDIHDVLDNIKLYTDMPEDRAINLVKDLYGYIERLDTFRYDINLKEVTNSKLHKAEKSR